MEVSQTQVMRRSERAEERARRELADESWDEISKSYGVGDAES